MKKGIVVSLCDFTGNMIRPWAEAGYLALCVDIQHPEGVTTEKVGKGQIDYWGRDIMDFVIDPGICDMVFAFPPCTHLSSSGARWFKSKGMRALIDALTLVERCRILCEGSGAPYMIENPVGTLATYWRAPNYRFDPCDFGGYLDPPGDQYTKRTCLWTSDDFIMPEPKRVEPVLGSKMHKMGPSPERANLRSETPMGFARAVFEANK